MISTYTAPGTKIVCINDDVKVCQVPGKKYNNHGLDGLKIGQIYTVITIVPTDRTKSGYSVAVEEITRKLTINGTGGFDISRFRKLELPKLIMDCLDFTKHDLDLLVEEDDYV